AGGLQREGAVLALQDEVDARSLRGPDAEAGAAALGQRAEAGERHEEGRAREGRAGAAPARLRSCAPALLNDAPGGLGEEGEAVGEVVGQLAIGEAPGPVVVLAAGRVHAGLAAEAEDVLER